MSLLAALLLAPGAAALLDLPANVALANVVAAATTTDPGLVACATAEIVMSSCANKPGFTSLPDASVAACLCCYSGTYLPSKYSSCSSYIRASATRYSSEASLDSVVSSFCIKQGNVCTASATATSSRTTTTTTTTTTSSRSVVSTTAVSGSLTVLAACTSIDSMLSSCARATPGFTTMEDKTAASCLCYNSADSYTGTRFDNFASSCASWARTSATRQYSDLAPLASFCDSYAPTSPRSNPASPTSTSADSGVTNGFNPGGTATAAGGSGVVDGGATPPSVTVTVTPSVTGPGGVQTTNRPAAAGRLAVGDWGAWMVGIVAGLGAIIMV